MNKMDLMDDAGRDRLRAIVRRFNPNAEIVECEWGRVDPKRLLGTGLFDLAKAEEHPDWLKEARIGEHIPESVEYGISSFTFRSRRPFDVFRFEKLTEIMESRKELLRMTPANHGEEAESPAKDDGKEDQQAALRVIRAKGLVWLANRQSHWQQGMASLAGRSFTIAFGAPWAAAVETAGRSAAETAVEPAGSDGDAREWGTTYELVIIGQDMDHPAIAASMQLGDRREMATMRRVINADLFSSYVRRMPGTFEDLKERIKKYNIEVVLPKKKKTQVLESTPKSVDVLSAHSCIASLRAAAVPVPAQFRRWCCSSHRRKLHPAPWLALNRAIPSIRSLVPELASGLVKSSEFPYFALMNRQESLPRRRTARSL